MNVAPSVAVAVVSRDRQNDLAKLIGRLRGQTAAIVDIVVVDSSLDPERTRWATPSTSVVRSEVNLGGAGGFALAILTALATGAEWVWLMDDDAAPLDGNCLSGLLAEAERRKLDVVSPLIVSPENPGRLSFPFRIAGKLSYDLSTVRTLGFLPNVAQFFNGALMRRSVFTRIGLPDLRLFVRGDEVDFMLRLRRARIPFGTVTSVLVSHPPGWREVRTIVKDRIVVLIPETPLKRYYFFRNRGFLARRHRRVLNFISDIVFYPVAFISGRGGNAGSLGEWACAYYDGLTYRFRDFTS